MGTMSLGAEWRSQGSAVPWSVGSEMPQLLPVCGPVVGFAWPLPRGGVGAATRSPTRHKPLAASLDKERQSAVALGVVRASSNSLSIQAINQSATEIPASLFIPAFVLAI